MNDSEALYAHPATYYRREDLLPAFESNEALRERFFGGVKKPIFTSANAHNHLVGLAEVLAMYLLVWSPAPWRLVRLEPPPGWMRGTRSASPASAGTSKPSAMACPAWRGRWRISRR
ncbi:isoleucyl-tRNA synthetase domain protein [Pseudomonas aeruginosa]|nr:isoleucyl-tRNA synthetase domain protein [Pseudomonas aeruginosa]